MTKWWIYPRSGPPELDSLGVGHAGDFEGNGYTQGYDYREVVKKV